MKSSRIPRYINNHHRGVGVDVYVCSRVLRVIQCVRGSITIIIVVREVVFFEGRLSSLGV